MFGYPVSGLNSGVVLIRGEGGSLIPWEGGAGFLRELSTAAVLFASRIETERITYDGAVCVRFAYHMEGDSIGQLALQVDGGSTRWQREGEQGDSWQTAAVDIQIRNGQKVSRRYSLRLWGLVS